MPKLCFSLCLTLLTIATLKAQPVRNLALEGGGIRGIAYAGALGVLEQEGLVEGIRNVAGTSAGAIAGAMISVGYSSGELKEILAALRVQQFNDGRWIFPGGIWRTLHRFGWYQGDALERWTDRLLERKTGKHNLTFGQLHALALHNPRYKDLFITATNLSMQRLTVFCYSAYPDMPVSRAVCASISIPLYFGAVFLDSNGSRSRKPQPGYDIYIDGGVVANYPLALFDSGTVNPATLGFKLERPEQIAWQKRGTDIAPYTIARVSDYVGALYNLVIEKLNRPEHMEAEQVRTIYISTGNISPRVRRLSTAQKEVLVKLGAEGAAAYLRRKQLGQ